MMNPDCIQKTRPVKPTLRVKISRWKTGREQVFSSRESQRMGCMLKHILRSTPGLSWHALFALLSVQCNAWHWTDIKSLLSVTLYLCLSVYVSPKYISSTIATVVFVRSSSNLECGSHMWQRRPSSMANKTGSGKRTYASIYFRFGSLLGWGLQ